MAERGINNMDLSLYGDKICGDYSGGNKRKLSTAIAFLGNPKLIFLVATVLSLFFILEDILNK